MEYINSEASLNQKAIKGGAWVFSIRAIQRFFNIVRLIILARLLVPHDFGMMGIALLVMAVLETFSTTGFQSALIQKKEETELYLNSAWTILIIRGIVLFIVMYSFAPLAGIFFKDSQAVPIIRVLGLSFLLRAFTNIGTIYFQKELDFKKQFIFQGISNLSEFIVVIICAFTFRNAWALVAGVLAGNFVMVVMSYYIHPYRARIDLNFSRIKELYNYGKWVFGSNVLILFITQGDDALVGKILGTKMLGFYQMAYRFSNIPATEITHVISQVAFPAYSKLQNDLPKLREAYLQVLNFTSLLSLPVGSVIFILTKEFTLIFLGNNWASIVPVMQILCIFGVTRALNATTGAFFHAIGKPSLLTKVSLIQLVFLIIIIFPLINLYGLIGVSVAVVISNIVCFIVAFQSILKIINSSSKKIFKMLFSPSLLSLIIISSIYFLKRFILSSTSIVLTFFLSITIILILSFIYILIYKNYFLEIVRKGNFLKET